MLADPHSVRITKADKNFSKIFDFEDIKFPVESRDIQKIEKKRIQSVLVFLVMKIRKNIQSTYQKNVAKKNMSVYY